MSDIRVTRRHNLGIACARAEVERIARRVQQDYGANYAWDGDTLRFSRSGVRGWIAVTDNRLDLSIKLDLLFKVMQARIEQRLVAKIDRHLARRQGTRTDGVYRSRVCHDPVAVNDTRPHDR